MSWIQTAYLIAEVIAIPLTGLVHARRLTLRWLFVGAVGAVHARHRSAAPSASGSQQLLSPFASLQGFSGGVLIPAVFSAVIHAVSAERSSRGCDHDRRPPGRGAGADHRPVVGGCITADLVVAVAVPDQRHSRARRCRAAHAFPACRRHATDARCAELEPRTWSSLLADGGSARRARDRPEGGAFAAAGCRRPALDSVARRALVAGFAFVRRTLARAPHPVMRLCRRCGDRDFALGCVLELLPRCRPVRLGLSDAGLPRLRARP